MRALLLPFLSLVTWTSFSQCPNQYYIHNNGPWNICASPGSIMLNYSEQDVSYQLKVDGSNVSAPLQGNWNSLTWNNLTTPGTYNVIATDDNSGCSTPQSGSVTLTGSTTTMFSLSGTNLCIGSGAGTVTLSGSLVGVNYMLLRNGNNYQSKNGTGVPLSWSINNSVGIYTVQATINGCKIDMNGSVEFANPLNQYSVSGGTTICSQNDVATVYLSNAQSGGSYQLKRNGVAVGSPKMGAGTQLQWSNLTAAGTYTITGTKGCAVEMYGNAIIYNNQPTLFNVSGQGCSNWDGGTVALSSSKTGVYYRLLLNGTQYKDQQQGTGGSLTWSNITNPGTYTVQAYNNSYGCNATMTGSFILLNAPIQYSVSGGGTFCNGSPLASITLYGSETGVSYQLKKDGINFGSSVAGTGSWLQWNNLTATGTFTVTGMGACTTNMYGNASIADNRPSQFNVTGASCTRGSVALSGSQAGINYTLLINGYENAELQKWGTGGPLTWTETYSAGTYSIKATGSTGCNQFMNGSVQISASPGIYQVTGGGNICSTGQQLWINQSSSQEGVSYQLRLDGITVGAPKLGNLDPEGLPNPIYWQVSASGTYTVVGTHPNGCSNTMSGSAIVKPMPALFTVSGGGIYCQQAASGLNITLSGSVAGSKYQLILNNGYGNNYWGNPLTGSGGQLTWTNQTTAGTYTIIETACNVAMTGSAIINNNSYLNLYSLGGGGSYCSGGSCQNITLSGSQTSTSYQLLLNGANSGSAISGTGSLITWANKTAPGTYTVVASNGGGFCSQNMYGSATISINPLPMLFSLFGGGSYCAGGMGVPFSLSGSEIGVNYQLKINGVNSGTALAGNGTSLSWTNQTIGGLFTIAATRVSTSCSSTMTGSVAVSTIPLPASYNIGGGGNYCPGTNGVSITLSSSQSGIVYKLMLNGAEVGYPLTGTGSALTWTNRTAEGTYTATALNMVTECTSTMTATATVTMNSGPSIFDVTGGGIIQSGPAGTTVTLSSTEVGVTYQLRFNSDDAGALLGSGTGSSFSWPGLVYEGSYSVAATKTSNGCTLIMNGAPEIMYALSNGTSVLNNFCFQYKYDSRQQIISKKVPGTDWVYMIYDNRDRLVMTQDGKQRTTNEWAYTKYDALNRPVITGIYTHPVALDQAGMKSLISNTNFFEIYNGVQATEGYTNTVFPTSGTSVLTVTYYDNYSYKSMWSSVAYDYVNDALNYNEYSQPGAFTFVTGHPTGAKIRVLDGGNTYLKTATYYDDHYRVIQSVGDNFRNATDRSSVLYDFTGKVIKNKSIHMVGTTTEKTIARRMDYDHAGRLLRTWHQIGGQPEVLLASNEYNELGQLVDKKLYSTNNGNSFKQSVDYRYNIRGWLTSINDSQLMINRNNDENGDLFGMNLHYNDLWTGLNTSADAQYNGNISAIRHSSNLGLGLIKERGYKFGYDPLNRLLAATHKEKAVAWLGSISYHENNLSYDLNGNILSLSRKGANGATMDVLAYNYGNGDNRTNKLMSVADAGDKTKGFVDGNTTGDDYVYDVNGNMIVDRNKSISAIAYNYLNLPSQVTKGNGEYLKSTYDANGRKLRQQVYAASNALKKNTDYAGEFFYENDTLKFINHEEGRIVMTGPTPEYQYHLKDHLGNVRATFTTKASSDVNIGTMEAANIPTEQSKFQRYDNAKRVLSTLLDHTNGALPGYATRLNGSTNEKFGLARSISVMPGDTLRLEVYAKYLDSNNTNWSAALTTLVEQIVTGIGGSVIDGAAYLSSTTSFPFAGLLSTASSTGGPKAYLNWLVFDRNYNFIPGKSGYQRMSTTAKEAGTDVAHERLASPDIIIGEPGYVYVYLSNEETMPVEVYFDDFKVTLIKSSVVQTDDYYPFGLTFNSYSRENSVPNRWKFQGQEHVDDLGLGWDSFKWRNHQPDIGRFFNVDPLAEKYVYNSLYAFSENKVTTHVELEGLEAFFIHGTMSSSGRWRENKNTIPTLMRLTNNKSYNADFNWNAPLNNNEKDRGKAAGDLASNVLKNRVKGEEITLIGHSHGGNVAIQAAKLIQEQTGEKVNIISVATPAYNGKGDVENPKTQKGSINDHIAIWNKIDGVSGGLAGDDNYSNSSVTNNAEVNVNQFYRHETTEEVNIGHGESVSKQKVTYDKMSAHSFDVQHPETIKNTKSRKLDPVQ